MPKIIKKIENHLWVKHPLGRSFIAELVGTYMLVIFNKGGVANTILGTPSGAQVPILNIAFCSGMALCFGIIFSVKISGGHVNSSLSFALFSLRKINFKHFVVYTLAQNIGSFMSAATIYGIYYDQIQAYDGGNYTFGTAMIFSSYPHPNASLLTCAFDETFASLLLMFGTMAVADDNNLGIPLYEQAFLIGMLLFMIIIGYGSNTKAAMNSALDFPPRIFSYCAGWGTQVFSHRDYMWFWIPIVFTHTGAVLGVWFYQIALGFQMPAPDVADEIAVDDKTDVVANHGHNSTVLVENHVANSTDVRGVNGRNEVHVPVTKL